MAGTLCHKIAHTTNYLMKGLMVRWVGAQIEKSWLAGGKFGRDVTIESGLERATRPTKRSEATETLEARCCRNKN